MGSSYADLVRKVNEKKKATTAQGREVASSASTGKSSSYADLVRKVNSGKYHFGTRMDAGQVEKWYRGVTDASKRGYEYLKKEGYRTADTALADSIGGYLDQARDVEHYLRVNKDSFEDYEQMLKDHAETVSYLRDLQKGVKGANDYYSSWESEDAYIKGAAEASGQRQQRYEDNQKKIEELRAQRALAAPGATYNPDSAFMLPVFDPAWAKVKEIDDQIAALEAENNLYERGEGGYVYKASDDYKKLTEKEDFEAGAANRAYENATREELWNYDVSTQDASLALSAGGYFDDEGNVRDAEGNIVQSATAPVVEDKLGLFLASSEDDVTEAYNLISASNGNYKDTWAEHLREGSLGSWRYLTEQEIGIYYYLLNTSQESAYRYLDDMKTELNRRQTLDENGQWKDAYDNTNWLGKVGMNIASVPLNLMSGVAGTVENWGNALQGKDKNPYSAAHSGMHFTQTVRGATAENLNQTGFKIPGLDYSLGDIYQVGMSRLDSALATAIGGKLGTVLLGMGAAQNETYKLYQQGASEEQATLGGILAGAAETVFEYASFDKLIKMKDAETVGQWVKNALIQGGIEASEEGFTEISNIVTNAIIMGGQSDLAQLYEENSENAWQTFLGLVKQTGQAAFGGFLGGLGAGTTEGGKGYIKSQAEFKRMGRPVMKVEGGVDALTALANEMHGVSSRSLERQSQKLAKNPTARKAGRLLSNINSAVTEQNSSDLAARLTEKGIDAKQAKKIAGAVIQLRTDYNKLTQEQMDVLDSVEGDDRVTEAVREVLDTEGTAAYQRSEGLRNTLTGLARGMIMQELGLTDASSAETVVQGENPEGGNPTVIERTTVESGAEDGRLLDGETFRRSTGDVVQVKTFTDFTGGKATVQLQDGTTAPAEDISFSGSDDGPFHLIATEENMTAPAANQMWQLWENIKANGLPVSADQYGSAAIALFRAGWRGDSSILSDGDSRAAALSKAQKELIYEAGRKARKADTDAKQANVNEVHAQAEEALGQTGAPQEGTYRAVAVDGLQVNKMNRQQKAAYEMASLIAPGVKGNVELYDGGKEWGYYDHKRDVIRLNINAKWNQTSMMTFTLGHELAHRAALGSPEKFQAFADFLVEKYVEQGTSLEELIGEQLQAADEFDKTLPEEKRLHMTETQALEEVVADACQRMLLDTDAGQKLAEFGAKSRENRSIVKDIKKWIREFMDRVRRSFRNVMPDSKAAQEFDRFDQQTKQLLADKLVDMIQDSGEKLSTIKAAGMTEKITTDRGGVRYMIRKNVVDINGNVYDKVVRPGLTIYDKVKHSKKTYVSYLHTKIFKRTFNLSSNDGSNITIEFAKANERVKKDGDKTPRRVLGELEATADRLKMIAIINIRDLLKNSEPLTPSNENSHQWLDAEGWRDRISYIEDNNVIYPVILHIPKTRDGRYLLYDISVKKDEGSTVDIDATALASTSDGRASTTHENESKPAVKSIEPSGGRLSQHDPDVNKKSDADEKMPHKIPVSRDVADRGKLVDLFEQLVTNSNEYKVLENYRKHMQEMMEIEEHLERIRGEIYRLSFAEGPRDMELLNQLKLQQKQAMNRLNYYDNRLLSIEKSGVLKAMLERYRKQITQESNERVASAKSYYQERNARRENEIRQYYRESRRQAVERHDKAEMRQRIRRDVQRLDSLLNKGTKERNVKAELKAFAGAALRTAKGTFLKDYSEYDMIRSGVNTTLSREQKAVFARCKELLAELDQIRDQKNAEPAPDSLHDKWDPEAELRREDREEALKKELAKNMAILREAGVFRTENELMEDSTAEQLMEELLDAYKALKDSESAHVRGVFSDAVYGQMEGVQKFLSGKAIKDMTSIELRELQKMYRMVLHTITTSNDLFAQKRKADVRKLGEEMIAQLRTEGKEMTSETLDRLAKMGWANLKPETALELIGSDTLTEMMQGLYRGEDTYALDIEHARQFAEEQAKKYGRKDWDLEKGISFAGTKITLGQAMSLYAYTKREQAQGHLEGDGFTHSRNVRIKEKKGNVPVAMKYIMNATKTHKVTKDMYSQVAQLLTAEQRKYVDAMQEYLSKVMGAKGNEVSMKLYGIDLFEETAYFPLKTAAEFRETALAAKRGDVKLKNSGFAQPVQKDAANPIVLDSFEKVWAAHVDKMSLYHGFVLPMEDFDRVYNYHRAEERDVTDAMGEVYKTELVDTNETVKVDIENKMGKAANEYIETFMQQLNGGVRGDPTENLLRGALKSFKKSAVMASLSVAVQQPTAFIRAMAYLDAQDVADWRNWLGKAGKPDGKLVEEMYKYAPVALMKKIGGFDPGLGRSAQNYIFGGSGVMDIVDKVGGWLPEHMDEWTWTYIWLCTKRQVHRQHPELRVGSEEFCEKAGERFSQIIRRTQVYDSVLTKSQIMRSKNLLLQMSTSFMNEPTTSLDMYISAAVQVKQGKISKKKAARVYGAVIGSQILVAAISSFVYAARDDDEDETYWEKYMSSFIGKSFEGVLMLQSIPFVRDVVSIFEGYSAERSDMALVEDLYQGWQKLLSSTATPWEKTEAFAGSILNFFGIPLKNVSRDVRAIFRVVENIINSHKVKATKAGMRYAAMEGLPFMDKPSKTVQMENAVKENDAEHILRLLGTYKTEDAAHTAFRKAVKTVYLEGKVTAEKAMDFLQVYAGNDAEEAQEYLIKWDFSKEHGDTELSDAQILDWNEYAKPAGISLEIYAQYVEEAGACEGDKNEDGKTISGSKKKKILAVIDGLPISRAQKDALYLSNDNFSENKLDEAPWN